MAELSDEEVSRPQELSDADVMQPPPRPAPPELPQAFIDRLRAGNALNSIVSVAAAAAKGTKEDFGPEPIGMSPEHVAQLQQLGVYRDPATGRGGALRLFNESILQPAAVVGDLLVRGAKAAIGGVAGGFGELASEAPGANEATRQRAQNEVENFLNYALLRGDQFARMEPGETPAGAAPHDQTVGIIPRDQDFHNGALALHKQLAQQVSGGSPPDMETTETNLRDLWETRGIHPAEAVHDAQADALLRHQLTTPAPDPADRSGLPHVEGSPIQPDTPRSELAKTGEPHIDNVLDSAVTKTVIDNPVIDRTHAVPYTAGGSVPLEDPTVFIDRRFPKSFTIDGVTFDPADPFVIHENVEQHVMELLTKGGMTDEEAYRVAHFEYAEKAEGAWYKAHGIDQAKAEAAYAPYMAFIQRVPAKDIAPNLYERPYPHDNPSAALKEPIAEPKPSKDEIARAKEIIGQSEEEGKLRALGSDVSAPMTPLAQQPPLPSGSAMAALHNSINQLFGEVGRDLQMNLAPMAAGSNAARVAAKNFEQALYRNRWDWSRKDEDLMKRFTPEQRERMWNAADEESVLRQEGKTSDHMGVSTLTPEERAAVQSFDKEAQITWMQMRDLGMVEGEGLPFWTPRAIVNAAGALEKDGALNQMPKRVGQNLRTTAASLRRRKYMTAEETEAAARQAFGDEAEIVRDIRVLPMSLAREQDAIAGRKLINAVKEYGYRTGDETVSIGGEPSDSTHKWFTVPGHPAFYNWRPKFEPADTEAYLSAVKEKSGVEVPNVRIPLRDRNGDIVFEKVPIYVRDDFEGPLKAVLSQRSGAAYSAAMALKGKTMGLIMNSPAIHLGVELGRAFPAMPGRMLTGKVFRDGSRARRDPEVMHEAIDAGLVPIGHRFFNQDINSIIEEPNLTPGRSFTAQVLGQLGRLPERLFREEAPPNATWLEQMFPKGLEGTTAEQRANLIKLDVDKAGDFWHNTLLWDNISRLQMGLYTNFRDDAIAAGHDRQTASIMAAHWANRFAGALPMDAMSQGTAKWLNFALFSRSFTMGNLGVMKDMVTGLPKEALARIEQATGEVDPNAVGYARGVARRRAIAIVAADIGLFYLGNSLLQSVLNVMTSNGSIADNMEKELYGYAVRFKKAMQDRVEDPVKFLQPLDFLQHVSSTSENEPGKEDYVRVGHNADGTAIYVRPPWGKLGGEFTGWMSGPLDMIRRKMGTTIRPAWQILSNDAGFGRKVYDPDPKTVSDAVFKVALPIAEQFFGSQVPEGQIGAFSDLVKGQGDAAVNAAQAFGPVAGFTFSKGAPGGERVGIEFKARAEHDFAVQQALPDIRRQIKNGDLAGAQQAMVALGIPKGLRDWYVRTTLNPSTAYLSKRSVDNFYNYATPEERQRFENAR